MSDRLDHEKEWVNDVRSVGIIGKGHKARRRRAALEDCPYKDEERAELWRQGWKWEDEAIHERGECEVG